VLFITVVTQTVCDGVTSDPPFASFL